MTEAQLGLISIIVWILFIAIYLTAIAVLVTSIIKSMEKRKNEI